MYISLDETVKMINEGKVLHIAADESLLDKLPKGRWIGGTTPYFISEDGGVFSKEMLFVYEIDYAEEISIATYGKYNVFQIVEECYDNGLTTIIIPYGSDVATAFADACRTAFSWEGPTHEAGALVLRVPESRTAGLTDDQRIGLEMGDGEGGTIPGWLGNFMGLKDVILYDSFIYWNQYCWSDEEYKWGYNGYCLGYYDPAVTKYFGLAYTESVMVEEGDDRYSPFRGIDPHDFVPE